MAVYFVQHGKIAICTTLTALFRICYVLYVLYLIVCVEVQVNLFFKINVMQSLESSRKLFYGIMKCANYMRKFYFIAVIKSNFMVVTADFSSISLITSINAKGSLTDLR